MKTVICAIAAATLLTGCASIVHPSKQAVQINTVPSGAKVQVDGKYVTSPATVMLKGKSDYSVIATKAGYQLTTGKIDSEVRILESVVGNIFNLTGVLGAAVDFLGTGAAYELNQSVTIPLQK